MDSRNCGYCKNCAVGNYDACTSFQPSASAEPAQEPIAWESTTSVYVKYVSDRRYRLFTPAMQRWYKPYRCSSCLTVTAAREQEASATGAEPIHDKRCPAALNLSDPCNCGETS